MRTKDLACDEVAQAQARIMDRQLAGFQSEFFSDFSRASFHANTSSTCVSALSQTPEFKKY